MIPVASIVGVVTSTMVTITAVPSSLFAVHHSATEAAVNVYLFTYGYPNMLMSMSMSLCTPQRGFPADAAAAAKHGGLWPSTHLPHHRKSP